MPSMFDERPFASDPVAYASRWDYLNTSISSMI